MLQDTCVTAEPFALTFRHLRVCPRAIVVSAHPVPALLASLRARLRAALAGTSLPLRTYDLVHTTLGRFAAPGLLSARERHAIESIRLSLTYHVTGLRLVRERRYPSLVLDELARLPFGASMRR